MSLVVVTFLIVLFSQIRQKKELLASACDLLQSISSQGLERTRKVPLEGMVPLFSQENRSLQDKNDRTKKASQSFTLLHSRVAVVHNHCVISVDLKNTTRQIRCIFLRLSSVIDLFIFGIGKINLFPF